MRTPDQAAALAATADGVVVGSALVNLIKDALDADGRPDESMVDSVTGLVSNLANGVRSAGAQAAE
ncbi:MAG: hypothetical protein ACR2PM_03455 [Hyphomicrobiales bacterium]